MKGRTQELTRANPVLEDEVAQRRRAEAELEASPERVSRTLNTTVEVLGMALEMRDPYTAGHQQGVARLAQEIAREMGPSPKQVEGLRLAALIYDPGKITVPTEILSKPGKLSDTEMAIIRRHAQAGYDIIKKVEFPWPVADWVLQHHERLDGSGYPRGLKGADLLLEARILMVADVVDAMLGHRPYRPAWGVGKALAEISQNQGQLYDPAVVEACLRFFKGQEVQL